MMHFLCELDHVYEAYVPFELLHHRVNINIEHRLFTLSIFQKMIRAISYRYFN